MRTAGELAKAAEDALALVTREPDVVEAEVFAAANSALLTRLNYTSHIPCNGVEEPKSADSYGIGIQAVFDAPDGRRIGFGSEPSDFTPAGVERALAKARKAAVRNEIATAERTAKAIQEKLDRLDEAFLFDRSIDIETYERHAEKLREELTLAQIDRHSGQLEELDVEGILAFAERILPRASDLWV